MGFGSGDPSVHHHLAWNIPEGLEAKVFFAGIPDIALAGVVVAVNAYANTLFSFIKLVGWRGTRRWTFIFAILVAIFSLVSFIQYLRAAHSPPEATHLPILFYVAATFAFATFLFAWAMQHTFVSDECWWARYELRQITSLGGRP